MNETEPSYEPNALAARTHGQKAGCSCQRQRRNTNEMTTAAVFANQLTASKRGSQSFDSQQEAYDQEAPTERRVEGAMDQREELEHEEGNVAPGDSEDKATSEQTDTEPGDAYQVPPTAKLYKKSDNGPMNWPEAERWDSRQEAGRHSGMQESRDNDESITAPGVSTGRTTADESELDVFNEGHLTPEDRSADENEFLDESTLANVDMPEEDLNEGTDDNGSQEQSSVTEDVFDHEEEEEETDRKAKLNVEEAEAPTAFMDVKLEFQAANGYESEVAAAIQAEHVEEPSERSDEEKPTEEVPFAEIQTHYEEAPSNGPDEQAIHESDEADRQQTEESRKDSIAASAEGEALEHKASRRVADEQPADATDSTAEQHQAAGETSPNEHSVNEEQKTIADEEDTVIEEGTPTEMDTKEEEEDEHMFHDYDALSMNKTMLQKQQPEESGSIIEAEEEEESEDAEASIRSQDTKEQVEEERRASVQEAIDTTEPREEAKAKVERMPSTEEVPLRKPSESSILTEEGSMRDSRKVSDAAPVATPPRKESVRRSSQLSSLSVETTEPSEEVKTEVECVPATEETSLRKPSESSVLTEEGSIRDSRKSSDVTPVETPPRKESGRRLSQLSNLSEAGSKTIEETAVESMDEELEDVFPLRKPSAKKSSEPAVTTLTPIRVGAKKFSLPTEPSHEVRSASSSRRSSDVTPAATPPRKESLQRRSDLSFASATGAPAVEEISEQDVEISTEYSLSVRKAFTRKASEPAASSPLTGSRRSSRPDHTKSLDIASETPLRRESLPLHSRLSSASNLEEKEEEMPIEQIAEPSADDGHPAQEALNGEKAQAVSTPPLTPSQAGSKRSSLAGDAKPAEVPEVPEEQSGMSSRKSSSAVPAETPSRKESMRSMSKQSTTSEASIVLKEEVQVEPEALTKDRGACQLESEEVSSSSVDQGHTKSLEQPPSKIGKLYKEIPIEAEHVPAPEESDKTIVDAQAELPSARPAEKQMEETATEMGVAEMPETEAYPEERGKEEEGRKLEANEFVATSPGKASIEAPVKTKEVQASTEYRQYYPLYESRTPATMSVSSMASSYSSDYSRPYNHYVSVFDSHVSTGPFSQSNYFTLRRSTSRERMSSSLSRAGSFSRFDSYHDFSPYTASRSTAQIPVRSTSFSRFMDYYDRVKERLKRTYSRESLYTPRMTHATYSYSNVFQPSAPLYGYNYSYSYSAPRRNVYRAYSQESVYTPTYRISSYPTTRTYGAFNKIYDYYSTIKSRYTQNSSFSPFRKIRSFYRPWRFDNSLF
uniref:Uncharacterized protein n=1 Tax=Trichuris muris TaxID=70415 RepID=A0A5S6QKY3_TRIMR